ncbi:MAG TPA: hypothetical protein DCP31_18600, partial [Cyanobacteria bacterium UBA8543]|nr:hypothetical protein [Cyanobacteria bacterium UBA8543]
LAKGNKFTSIPKAGLIISVSGSNVKYRVGNNRAESARQGFELLSNRRLLVPGIKTAGASIGFVSATGKIPNYLVSAGYSSTPSEYWFPCRGKGGFVIGWRRGDRNNLECRAVQLGATNRINPSVQWKRLQDLYKLSSVGVKQQEEAPGQYPTQKAEVHVRQYCSAAAGSGQGWGIALPDAKFRWTPDSQNELCDRAIKKCNEVSSGNSCSVVSMGEWITTDSDFTVSLQCDDDRERQLKGDGNQVPDLVEKIENQAKSEGAKACVLNMYARDEVLVSPISDTPTLIQSDSSTNNLVINVLTSAVNVKDSKTVTFVEAGQRYIYRRQNDGTYQGTKASIPPEEREAIYNSPAVQEFLKLANWTQDIAPQIEEYRAALNIQFYQPPASPAVQVEETVVNGVAIWKATIDLNNPQTIVTLAPTADVQKAGGFASFVKNSNAALIASGTFKEDKGWTMISEGELLGNTGESKGWSNYTVLGLKSRNLPELSARAKLNEQNWAQYWFAITGHPRLVSNGIPGVTEIAPDSTLNKTGAVGRAAIGFSSKTKTLYHVITKVGISLQKLAEVMRAIGCDEAMNLEGGNGRLLAQNGTILVSGEVRAPLIVVYDAKNKAPDNIRIAWERFQNVDNPSVSR